MILKKEKVKILVPLFIAIIVILPGVIINFSIVVFRENLGYKPPVTSFNEEGFPQTKYYINCNYTAPQYNPYTLFQLGFDWLNNNEVNKTIRLVNFLLSIAKERGKAIIWEYGWTQLTYQVVPGWISGLAQSQALKTLSLLYKKTLNASYLVIAYKVFNSFLISVKQGGVTYFDTNDSVWFEEVASPHAKIKPRILNGHIFALLGIHYFYEITNNSTVLLLFNKGLIGLKRNIEEYFALNYWTFYDAIGNLASEKYQKIHARLMLELYQLTNDSFFKELYQKFENMLQNHLSLIPKIWYNPIFKAYFYLELLIIPLIYIFQFLYKKRKLLNIRNSKTVTIASLFISITFVNIIYELVFIYLIRYHLLRETFLNICLW